MATRERIEERLRALSSRQQEEVLDFVEFLLSRRHQATPTRGIGGACEDLGISITASEIDAVRSEMLGGFPRSDV